MSVSDLAYTALNAVVKKAGKKGISMKDKPESPKAEKTLLCADGSGKFNVGFSSMVVMPEDVGSETYWMAGYKMKNKVTGVIDPLTVNAMWLDCGQKGILFVSADFVGLTGAEVKKIRRQLDSFCDKVGCVSVIISCTHTHAGIDTAGCWGPAPLSGLNKKYMLMVEGAVVIACRTAYQNRKSGDLFLGSSHVPEAQKDGREPIFARDVLTRLRFVPDDGSTETWYLNYGCHPNTLGGKNSLISADYPCYMRRRINRDKKVNVMFSVGAIGAISPPNFSEDKLENTVAEGTLLGEKALEITDEVKLKPQVTLRSKRYYAPVDNPVHAIAAYVKMAEYEKHPYPSELGVALLTEMNLISIDTLNILTLPGEIFPELVYGDEYSTEETSATGFGPDINPDTLTSIVGDENLVIFGVSNDFTGYILPPNDFILHETSPYVSTTHDRFDRHHYQETNSLGPNTAFIVADSLKKLLEETAD